MKGALFDWDGVVLDSSRAHEEAWNVLARREGLPIAPELFPLGFGKRNEVVIPDVYGWTRDPEEIQRLGDAKEAIYREIMGSGSIEPMAGVRVLLENLRHRGIRCCIATSTPRLNIEAVLPRLGLESFFAGAVCSEDVQRGKPDPEVFEKAAERLGLNPRDCVVFEDATYGIEAGRAAGAFTVGVATTHPIENLLTAHVAVSSLAEIDLDALIGYVAEHVEGRSVAISG